MPVRVLVGDLFDSDAQTLVNTVNCVGVMGRGVALGFRKRFPDMFKDYVARCDAGQVELGHPYLFQHLLPPWILNFPTKDHWRSVARLSDIISGLEYVEANYREWGIDSLAVPPLGCGEGQLDWRVVGPELYRRLMRLEIPVDLYAPFGTPNAQLEEQFLMGRAPTPDDGGAASARRVPVGWFGLVAVVGQLASTDPSQRVGRVVLHKLAYFASDSGVPVDLNFERGAYGPFAPALKQVVTKLVNNGLLVEVREGRSIVTKPGSTYDDAARAFGQREVAWRPAVDRVVTLVGGLEPRAIEVLATTLFVVRAFGAMAGDEAQIEAEVMAWKQHRRPAFTTDEVGASIARLRALGWIEASESGAGRERD